MSTHDTSLDAESVQMGGLFGITMKDLNRNTSEQYLRIVQIAKDANQEYFAEMKEDFKTTAKEMVDLKKEIHDNNRDFMKRLNKKIEQATTLLSLVKRVDEEMLMFIESHYKHLKSLHQLENAKLLRRKKSRRPSSKDSESDEDDARKEREPDKNKTSDKISSESDEDNTPEPSDSDTQVTSTELDDSNPYITSASRAVAFHLK